jgi:hypothetical protein
MRQMRTFARHFDRAGVYREQVSVYWPMGIASQYG